MFQSNKGCYSPLCPVGNLSWLIHLILQGLDIREQNIRERRKLSPFSQSVADPSVFPAVLLDLLPRGVIQVAIVHLCFPENLKWSHWIRG